MRKSCSLLSLVLLLFCTWQVSAETPSASPLPQSHDRIGKIDLALAVSLHPRMSMFDFDRMGFFKVQPGLDEKAFTSAVAELRQATATVQAQEKKDELQKKIAGLERQRAELSAALHGANQSVGENLSNQLQSLANEQQKLTLEISDLDYRIECPELTSPDETRKILGEIETETIEAVARVAREKQFRIIFNNSIPYSTGYPQNYLSGPMFGQGVPGINVHLFYSFLARSQEKDRLHEVPPSRNVINWLELTSYPGAVNLLPIKPWPMVLYGGQSILSDVLRIVYTNHRISSEVFQTLDSVIHKIEQDNSIGIE